MDDDKVLAFLASLAARRRGGAMVLDSSALNLDAMVVADIFDCDILTDLEVANAIVAACHEYAARRRDQTHHAECWREAGHEECARRLLERWAPVMEAAEARQRAWLSYQNAPGFSAERDRLRGEYMRAAERFDSAILKACAALAALKEGNDEQNTTQA